MVHFLMCSGDSLLHFEQQRQNLGYKYFITMKIIGWWRRLAMVKKEKVIIFDSLLDSEPHMHIIYAESQIFLEKKNNMLKLSVIKIQQQKRFRCGLFAIANATALAFLVESIGYVYDQFNLRSHFILCCRNWKIEPFPFI